MIILSYQVCQSITQKHSIKVLIYLKVINPLNSDSILEASTVAAGGGGQGGAIAPGRRDKGGAC